jgi:hypothetical protein
MILMKRHLITACILLVVSILPAQAQETIKSPAEFLGYELGEHFTYHHQVVSYFNYVAETSSMVELEYYGATNERRPLLVVYVSSPENIHRREDIRLNNLRRTGVATGTPSNDNTAIVWLSYNIHGNESVSMEASMQTLFELVSPTHPETKPWLENALVIMDPTINPDGRDRYANWFNQTVGAQFNPDPNSREHQEPWPGGRANHYLFDLNRDWAWQTQIESQQRGVLYQKWLPHVHGDFHEMGGYRYYFLPAANPYHEKITQWQRDFQVTIGDNIARHFDKDHRLYFTREVFDLFYPSYGDTWPTYQGAIGMTYEQGGGGRAGLGILTERGDTLTLKDRISNQHLAGKATVEAVALAHDRVVSEFKKFYDDARNNPNTTYKSYILRVGNNHDNVAAMLDLLDKQGITYGRASATRVNAFDYSSGTTRNIAVTNNDIVISMYQPKSTLANILLEPRTTIVDSLTYDLTAWAVPYIYGVEAYATTQRINPTGNARELLEMASIQGFSEPVVAYLFKYNSFKDAQFLAALHKNGFSFRVSSTPFTTNGQEFDRGTIVVTPNGNKHMGSEFDSKLRSLASDFHRIPVSVSSARSTSGVDLGSESVQHANKPSVVVLSGNGVSSLAFGEVWHFFEQQLHYPATVIDVNTINRVDLTKYDVIILPEGRYTDFLSSEKLSEWISAGGRLIAMEGAVSQLSSLKGFSGLKTKELPEPDDSLDARLRIYGNQEREAMKYSLAGGIFKVTVDNTHPLAFGYSNTYFTLKRSTNSYEYLSKGWNVGHVPANGLVGGFVGSEIIKNLEESFNFGVVNMGRGQIVAMVDNPLFRGFWYNGRLLFTNAVFQPM